VSKGTIEDLNSAVKYTAPSSEVGSRVQEAFAYSVAVLEYSRAVSGGVQDISFCQAGTGKGYEIRCVSHHEGEEGGSAKV
jgi:hypothetical protein